MKVDEVVCSEGWLSGGGERGVVGVGGCKGGLGKM